MQRLLRALVRRLRGRQDLDSIKAGGACVGRGVTMAQPVLLDPAFEWLITIGDQATLGPDVKVIAHDASMKRLTGYTLMRPVTIGERAYIGAAAVILPGVTVGADAVVGAGSVVRHDVPAGALVVGNPAKVVGTADEYRSRHLEAMESRPVFPVSGLSLLRESDERKTEIRASLESGPGYVR